MSYYNTTSLTGLVLKDSVKKAESLDKKVLDFFKANPNQQFTPPEVWQHIQTEAPLTSVRRSINTMTKDGHLEKTTNKKQGIYGSPNFTWVYREKFV